MFQKHLQIHQLRMTIQNGHYPKLVVHRMIQEELIKTRHMIQDLALENKHIQRIKVLAFVILEALEETTPQDWVLSRI